jgi:hypothetical protein
VPNLFEDDRCYVLGDTEPELLGDRDKLAQWRHKGVGPAYYKIGRKVVYRGSDLILGWPPIALNLRGGGSGDGPIQN